MKSIVIISFLLLLGLKGFGQRDSNLTNAEGNNYGVASLYIEYYDNGRTKLHGYCVGTLKNSTWTYWFNDENGHIMKIENFINGKNSGEYIEYYINGKIKIKGNYVIENDTSIKDKYWFYYNEQGKLIQQYFYMNGVEYENKINE